MKVNGVEVDFVGEYAYPYFLRRYKGYILKVVNSICNKEVEESNKLLGMGYLPIFILRPDVLSYVKDITETEKRNFSFKYSKIEIEKDIFNFKNFKGIILICLSDDNTVCCTKFETVNNNVIVQGLSGSLRYMIDGTLAMYNRRIV